MPKQMMSHMLLIYPNATKGTYSNTNPIPIDVRYSNRISCQLMSFTLISPKPVNVSYFNANLIPADVSYFNTI